ncbi:uncharacterized protein wgn [Panulirus ornatus]|uniref:uncharacterized protein wgn n=1 Tax=Panulirus ornatus TaxID=150431 RepID=UPI003A854163
MVGRGWWLLVWTVYTAWTVGVVCGGSSCQQGQEFYSSQQGRCVPCTRCHGPQVVVISCYVFQDTVCASAAQFLPTWSRFTQPQAPTLSTPTTVENITEKHRHGQRTSKYSSDNYRPSNNHKKTSGHQQGKSGIDKGSSTKNSHSGKSRSTLQSQYHSENRKTQSKRQQHHHRHTGEHTEYRAPNKSVLVETKESLVSSVSISDKSDASESVSEMSSGGDVHNADDGARNSFNDFESVREDVSDGANSDKDKELHEPETADWQSTFFLIAVIVIAICVILLTILTVSHLRSVFTRWKLTRVCDAVPGENSGELTVMEHLLPAVPSTSTNRAVIAMNRTGISYVRSVSITPVPSSSTTTNSGVMVVDSERTNGHVYPPIPFTMDRLLEQRRVLGPASSVDTNLYIESWQQQDSHTAAQHPPSTSPNIGCHRTFLTGSVSACPSPVPVRTYRLGPASTSASPIIPARGLGPMQGRMRGMFASPVCTLSGSSGGVVINGCASVEPT